VLVKVDWGYCHDGEVIHWWTDTEEQGLR
jgi:hypothetical protein